MAQGVLRLLWLFCFVGTARVSLGLLPPGPPKLNPVFPFPVFLPVFLDFCRSLEVHMLFFFFLIVPGKGHLTTFLFIGQCDDSVMIFFFPVFHINLYAPEPSVLSGDVKETSSHSGIPQLPSSWECTEMLLLSPSAQIWDEAAQSSSCLPCGNSVVHISVHLSIIL